MSGIAGALSSSSGEPTSPRVDNTGDKGIPTVDQCKRILDDQGVKVNIKEHSLTVCYLATNLVANLKCDLDPSLVAAMSLLHDITKTRSLITNEPHDVTGGELIRKLGYPKVAPAAEQHLEIKNFDINSPLREEELVCYADKRVLHSQVVNLTARKLENIKRVYQVHQREDAKAQAMQVIRRFELYKQLELKIDRLLQTPLYKVIPDISITVTFKWEYEGREVFVAGDFSEWYMIPTLNNEVRLDLAPGTYYYKYVVDGVWMFDMKRHTQRDPAGNTNNVVTVYTY